MVLFVATSLLLPGARTSGGELLPAFRARVEGARYLPADRDFEWVGWVGAGATLVRAGKAELDFDADVETILGHERRAFDANQANYHLELAAGRPWKAGQLALFFHHVSRHASDRDKPQVRNWNVLGVRARHPLPACLGVPGTARLSVGPALYSFELGYRWEVVAALEVEVLRRASGTVYSRGGLRWVAVRPDPLFERGSFVDAGFEAGWRVARRAGALEAYLAVESRNDAGVFLPDQRTGARLGVRLALRDDRN